MVTARRQACVGLQPHAIDSLFQTVVKIKIIADVLGHYESHLEYLRISAGSSDAAIGESKLVITDWRDDFEPPEPTK